MSSLEITSILISIFMLICTIISLKISSTMQEIATQTKENTFDKSVKYNMLNSITSKTLFENIINLQQCLDKYDDYKKFGDAVKDFQETRYQLDKLKMLNEQKGTEICNTTNIIEQLIGKIVEINSSSIHNSDENLDSNLFNVIKIAQTECDTLLQEILNFTIN